MTPALTAETWLPVLREALEHEGSFRFTLRGNSMRPTLPIECTIEIHPLPHDTRPGALIVFASRDSLIAHRLVAQHRDGWIAQGDGRLGPDALLAPSQVFGVVTAAYLGTEQIWPGPLEGLLGAAWVARYHLLRPVRWGRRRLLAMLRGDLR